MAGTLSTAAALALLFGLYCLGTRSLRAPVEAAPIRPAQEVAYHVTGQEQTVQAAMEFLANVPGAAWATKANKQFQTADGNTYYYFNNWSRESENVIHVDPFAVISRAKGAKPGDAPYVILSDSAYVTFAQKITFVGSPGGIVRAGLQGKVHIQGPNHLTVDGSNFFFEREAKRLYCDKNEKKIRFQYDNRVRGTADGMQLELIMADNGKKSEALEVQGLSSLKLLQNVDMTLIGDGANQFGLPQAKTATVRSKPVPGRPQVAQIHSDGSFNYVIDTHRATFERNVTIKRNSAPGQTDSLLADQTVEILFEPPSQKTAKPAQTLAAKAPAAPGAKAGSPTSLQPDLTFKTLHAWGRRVYLVAQSNGLQAEMSDLYYDRSQREATLSAVSGPPSGRAEVNPQLRTAGGAAPLTLVNVIHNGDSLKAPQVHLVHNEPGDDITLMECRGAGGMKHRDEKTKEVDLAAYWRKEMRKYSELNSPFDRVDLEEAIIEQPKQSSGIAANHMSLYLRRPEKGVSAPSGKSQNTPQLDHMFAWQSSAGARVAMLSPQIEAEAIRLEVWFHNVAPAPAPSPAPGSGTDPRRPRLGLSPTVLFLPEGDHPVPASPPPGQPIAAPASTTPAKKVEPYRLNAATIRVEVAQDPAGGQPHVDEMIAKGDAEEFAVLAQSHEPKSPGAPIEELRIDGKEIQVQNRSEKDQEMLVLGQPAHVRDRGSHIEGSRIRFNRLKNTADVDGAGRLQLPVRQSNDATPTAADLPLDVDWQKQMHFDGITADFFGNVHTIMDESGGKSDVRCRKMSVTLTKPFSFTDQRPNQEQPQIDNILCTGGVAFESEAMLDGKRTEVRRGTVARLRFDQLSHKSQAEGPGLLKVWRFTGSGRSGLAQFTNAQANSPPKARKKTEWEFVEVRFTGRMDGSFRAAQLPSAAPSPAPPVQAVAGHSALPGSNGSWTTVFHDNVQCLYGTVEQPPDTVSRDDLLDDSGWLGCEVLEITQHPQSTTQDQHITLLATKNSQIEGKTFRGVADIISYDGSKSLYVLNGENGRPARLWRQLRPGADWDPVAANRIDFNTVRHTVHLDQAVDINAAQ